MSEHVQKQLSQLVKTQLEKKSSKKTDGDFSPKIEAEKSKVELYAQKQKVSRVRENEELGAKVSEKERLAMYFRLFLDNVGKFFLILLYCVVAFVAVAKAGIIILSAFQHFLHGIFIPAEVIPTNKS